MLPMRLLRFGTLLPLEDPSLSFPLFPFLPTLRNLDTYLTHTIRVWIAIEGNNMSKAQWRAAQSLNLDTRLPPHYYKWADITVLEEC